MSCNINVLGGNEVIKLKITLNIISIRSLLRLDGTPKSTPPSGERGRVSNAWSKEWSGDSILKGLQIDDRIFIVYFSYCV